MLACHQRSPARRPALRSRPFSSLEIVEDDPIRPVTVVADRLNLTSGPAPALFPDQSDCQQLAISSTSPTLSNNAPARPSSSLPSSADDSEPASSKASVPRSSSPPSADVKGALASPWKPLNLPSPWATWDLENGKVLSVTGGKHVVRLPSGIVVKRGEAAREGEAEAMALVCTQGVPIPELLGFYTYMDSGYLFMNNVDGVTFDKAWPHLSPEQRSSLLSSISSVVARIHSLSRDFIGSPDGTAPTSLSVLKTRKSSLSSPRELLEHLQLEFAQRLKGNDFYTPSAAFLSLFDDPLFVTQSSFRLQHCDLAPRNILVDPVSGELKAIIDWEEAAFLPVGFEYAALRFESWLSQRAAGGKELCEALMALATEDEKRIGEILWDDIGRFLEAVRWLEEGQSDDC